MLIVEKLEIAWSGSNRKHFESLGYIYTKRGDVFTVFNTELSKGSHTKVKVLCDYCESEVMVRAFKTHAAQRKRDKIKKDACKKCRYLKVRESNLLTYGVEWVTQTENFKEKSKITNLERYGSEFYQSTEEFHEKTKATHKERYGVEYTMQNPDFQKKSENTLMKKHGVKNPMHVEEYRLKQENSLKENYGVTSPLKSPEILAKVQQTNKERYGGISPASSEEVRNKIKETNIRVYGVPHPMQNAKVQEKLLRSLYKNGTMKSSSQQNHIHTLVGGELNYPVSRSSLDIAFPEEMIYIEYDGGGHSLSVKLGELSKEEFDKKERSRTFFLFDRGWREIRLVSENDKLPRDEEIIKTVNKAKCLLKNERVKTIIVNWDRETILFGFKKEFSLEDFLTDDFTFPQKEVS